MRNFKDRIAAKFMALSSFRKVFVGLSFLTMPTFVSVGFGVQAINPIVEEGKAIIFFTAAAVNATLFFWAWEEITELKPSHRRIAMAAFGFITTCSLYYGVSWVVNKAEDAAWELMIRYAHDGFTDVMTRTMYAELMKPEHAASKRMLPTSKSTPVQAVKPASFVYIVPGVWVVTGTWDFIVNHRGPESSYHVEILFVDEVKRDQILVEGKTSLTQVELNSYQLSLKYPEINPKGRGSIFATQFLWTPPLADHERYAIDITWRDGSVHQDLQVERVGGKWLWATQIKDRETAKILVNCRDKTFPYGPLGDKPCFPEMALPAD